MGSFDQDPPGLQAGLTFRLNLSDMSDWSLDPYIKYQHAINKNLKAGVEASASLFGNGRDVFHVSPHLTYQKEVIPDHLLATTNLAAHYTHNGIGTSPENPNLLELTASGALTAGGGRGVPSPLNSFHAKNGTAAQDPFAYSATLGRNYTYSFGRDENDAFRGFQRTGYFGFKGGGFSAGLYNDADRFPWGIKGLEAGTDQYRTSGLNVALNTRDESLLYANDLYFGKSDRLPNKIDPKEDIKIGNNYYDNQTPFDMALNNGQDNLRLGKNGVPTFNISRFGAESLYTEEALHKSENFHFLYSQYGNNNNVVPRRQQLYQQSYDEFDLSNKLTPQNQDRNQKSVFDLWTD